jgi:hypothetical protein
MPAQTEEDKYLDPFHQVVAHSAAANPLSYIGTGYGAYGDYGREPNPLSHPPVPVQELPIAQQIAWHDQIQKERANENTNQSALLDIKSKQYLEDSRTKALTDFDKLRERAQTELDPSKDDYLLTRNRLISDHIYAVNDPRYEHLLKDKDTVYQKKQELQKESTEHQRNLNETRMTSQIATAREMLKGSPELLANFELQVANDPAAAVAFAAQKAGEYKQQNTVADLKAYGYTDDQIKRDFTSPSGDFLFAAADRRTKELEKAGTDEKRDLDIYNAQLAQKNAIQKAESSSALIQDGVNKWKQAQALDKKLADPNLTPAQRETLKTQRAAIPDDQMIPSEWTPEKEAVLGYYQQVAQMRGIRAVQEAQAEAKRRGIQLAPQTQPEAQPQTQPPATPPGQPPVVPGQPAVATQQPVTPPVPAAPSALFKPDYTRDAQGRVVSSPMVPFNANFRQSLRAGMALLGMDPTVQPQAAQILAQKAVAAREADVAAEEAKVAQPQAVVQAPAPGAPAAAPQPTPAAKPVAKPGAVTITQDQRAKIVASGRGGEVFTPGQEKTVRDHQSGKLETYVYISPTEGWKLKGT